MKTWRSASSWRGKSSSEIETAVEAAADLLDIRHLLDRKPKTLSGGQRQRVAIGRAIVRQPSVFLFDEPLSNLDAALRVRMRYEFARLHKRLKTTTIYVTHDQVEAMTLADRIAILDRGEIHQLGTAEELYQRPASRFVAGFVGSPQMNFIEAKLDRGGNDRAAVKLRNGAVIEAAVNVGSHSVGEPVTLGIRPEHLVRVEQGGLPATVALIEWLGNMQFAYVTTDVSDEPLIMQLPAGQKLDEGRVDHDRRETRGLPPVRQRRSRLSARRAFARFHGRLRRGKPSENEPLAVSDRRVRLANVTVYTKTT